MQHPNPIPVVAIDARGAARSRPLTERLKPLCSWCSLLGLSQLLIKFASTDRGNQHIDHGWQLVQ